MSRHPLVKALLEMRGNVRACVYTEPLWGIPYNLYMPYMSVYMLALGVNDVQIGLITSIGIVFQIFTSLLGGIITDKLGRRKTTVIFDLISWSVPCLIWAVAQNFTYFLIAAIINSLWRITSTSWTCLMVEDADPTALMDIYAWIYISGQVAAFFAPLAGLFVSLFTLVPTMRGLFIVACIVMSIKFIALYHYSDETKRGAIRMHEAKNQSLFSLGMEYWDVLKQIFKTPQTLYTIAILLLVNTCSTINTTFWSILVTKKLLIPTQYIVIYPFIRSALMLLFFFTIMPRIRHLPFHKPLLVGLVTFILSQVILINVPVGNYLILACSTFLEAFSMATVNPMMDRLTVINVDEKERARIMALIYVIVLIFTSPFGWIGGMLSEMNRIYPFVMNIGLFALAGVLTFFASRQVVKKDKGTAVALE